MAKTPANPLTLQQAWPTHLVELLNLSANLSWEKFLCSVFMTRARRAYRLVPENAENILLKLLKGEFEAVNLLQGL